MPTPRLSKKYRDDKRTFYPTVSFILPVLNKEASVAKYIERLFNYASKYAGFVEIFVVDNGSKDQTYEVAYAAIELNKRKNPRVRTKLIRLTATLKASEILEMCSKSALGQKIAIVTCKGESMEVKVLE